MSRIERLFAPLTRRSRSELAASVLGRGGVLSARKVFSRRDVIVAVTPHLFGRNPAELDKIVDRVLRDPDAVRLVGVPRASERAYATASVLADETAVETAVARGVGAVDGPRVTLETATAAVNTTATVLRVTLTDGQVAAVVGIATSGRQVELVEGVAGSGKTTVMAAVRQAFVAGGFTVLGTSTSGQAARTLGSQAGIDESMTVASLRWQVEHGRRRLTPGHVVILDEAGMTSDRDVAFLLDQARLGGSKIVMVGDDRQLGAVDVGGAMGALAERHGGMVHTLSENVRQHDLAEREALAELRAGDVTRAVEFYLAADRVVVAPGRTAALAELVNRWAQDVEAGSDAAMFAWRRANVAELNRLARDEMAVAGRLSGPDLPAPGGARYAAGDRIVTLAPGAQGKVVTSERGVVVSVDVEAGALTAQMDDGRRQRFGPDETGADRLAHGYATTVHRSQGATCDRAHVYEDGGGRELAYVAMSRAREATHVYLAADGAGQAREDLVRSWTSERRWKWAIDTGTPQLGGPEPAGLRREALTAERAALAAGMPRDVTVELSRAVSERDTVAGQLERLRAGGGLGVGGELHRAVVVALSDRRLRLTNEEMAGDKDVMRKLRRDARQRAETFAVREQAAWEKVAGLFAPEERRLVHALSQADRQVVELAAADGDRARWLAVHLEVPGRLREIDAEIASLDGEIDLERRAVVSDLYPPPEYTPTPEHDLDRHHDHHHDIEPDYGLGF